MKYERTAEAQREKSESRPGRLLCEVFGGAHHVQWPSFKWLKHGWSASYMFYGDCSTWDFNTLTRLVVAAHAHAVRVEIVNGGPRRLKLYLHPRTREGRSDQRHPTLADALIILNADPNRDELAATREQREQSA